MFLEARIHLLQALEWAKAALGHVFHMLINKAASRPVVSPNQGVSM